MFTLGAWTSAGTQDEPCCLERILFSRGTSVRKRVTKSRAHICSRFPERASWLHARSIFPFKAVTRAQPHFKQSFMCLSIMSSRKLMKWQNLTVNPTILVPLAERATLFLAAKRAKRDRDSKVISLLPALALLFTIAYYRRNSTPLCLMATFLRGDAMNSRNIKQDKMAGEKWGRPLLAIHIQYHHHAHSLCNMVAFSFGVVLQIVATPSKSFTLHPDFTHFVDT